MFHRKMYHTLLSRLAEPRRFVQVLSGPRQTGKTTLARQVMAGLEVPTHYASADEPGLKGPEWLEQQWDLGRLRARGGVHAVLFLDEIHKLPAWSEIVKRLWDWDSAEGVSLRVVLLGSSPLLLHQGLSESLAGRFEILRVPHWSLVEMRDAFGYDLDDYLVFGGYPGAAELRGDFSRWRSYVLDSLVETTISRDVLMMARVDKPALLRRTFELACSHSGMILSYQKMVGQLQDAGNTTTIAHYLKLLSAAGMVAGIEKYSGAQVRQRASSPKLQVLNTALLTAHSGRDRDAAATDRSYRGRLVESAVGSHLMNQAPEGRYQVHYWRHGNREVDFVVSTPDKLLALEVKSGRARDGLPGLRAFQQQHGDCATLLVGPEGIRLEEFLASAPAGWLAN